MDSIEQTVVAASKTLTRVRRRPAGARGLDGRFTPGTEIVALAKLSVQPGATNLSRQLTGDSTTGTIQVEASLTLLAQAYLEGDPDQAPLLWTGLRIAPPEDTGGPPGDRIDFQGREYELTVEEIWDADGLVPAPRYRAYTGTERGRVAP